MRLSIQNPRKAGKGVERDYFCLNCRKVLPTDARGIDARRFCSYECKDKYLAGGD